MDEAWAVAVLAHFPIPLHPASTERRSGICLLPVQAGVSLQWFFPGDAANCLTVSVDGEQLVVYSGCRAEELQVPKSSRLLLGALGEGPLGQGVERREGGKQTTLLPGCQCDLHVAMACLHLPP